MCGPTIGQELGARRGLLLSDVKELFEVRDARADGALGAEGDVSAVVAFGRGDLELALEREGLREERFDQRKRTLDALSRDRVAGDHAEAVRAQPVSNARTNARWSSRESLSKSR